jgi:hypothetical protein
MVEGKGNGEGFILENFSQSSFFGMEIAAAVQHLFLILRKDGVVVRVCGGGIGELDCAVGVDQESGGRPVGEVGGALDDIKAVSYYCFFNR